MDRIFVRRAAAVLAISLAACDRQPTQSRGGDGAPPNAVAAIAEETEETED